MVGGKGQLMQWTSLEIVPFAAFVVSKYEIHFTDVWHVIQSHEQSLGNLQTVTLAFSLFGAIKYGNKSLLLVGQPCETLRQYYDKHNDNQSPDNSVFQSNIESDLLTHAPS